MCCKNIVVQVLVVACVVSLAAGNPQFFPISNLRQYLEHKRQTALRDSAIEQQKTGRGTTTGPREVYLEPSRPVTGHPAYRVPSQPSSASNQPFENLQHPYESTVLPKLSLKPQIPTQTERAPVDRVGLTTKDVRPQFPDPEFDVTSRPAYPKKYSSYQPPPPRREKPVYVGADGVTKVKLLKKPSGYNPEVPPYMTQSHSHYPFQFTKHAEIPDQHRPSHEFPVQAPSDVLRRQQHPEEKRLQSSKHGPPAAPSSGVQTSRPPRAQTWNPKSQAAINQNPQIHDLVANTYGDRRVRQSAAETGFSPAFSGGGDLSGSPSSSGDRVEFQIHGQEGPHSYRFGFDTGKGHNRQFRYEERDSEGLVKGRYGFYDKTGKLQVVNYSAHPHHGFQADGNFGKYPN